MYKKIEVKKGVWGISLFGEYLIEESSHVNDENGAIAICSILNARACVNG